MQSPSNHDELVSIGQGNRKDLEQIFYPGLSFISPFGRGQPGGCIAAALPVRYVSVGPWVPLIRQQPPGVAQQMSSAKSTGLRPAGRAVPGTLPSEVATWGRGEAKRQRGLRGVIIQLQTWWTRA